MAFDVYVGTMTRFYRRDWENVAQRMAREKGFKYNMVLSGGEPGPPLNAEVIRQAVDVWSQALTRALLEHGVGPVIWNESEKQPYFTERPAWEGYRALLLWAAYNEHPDLIMPLSVPDSWCDDPAFLRSSTRESKSRYQQILTPE